MLVDDALGLYIVADGMGGHQAGEVASRLVVESIRDYMKRFSQGISVEELEDTDTSLSRDANRILAGINLSNRVVNEIAGTKAAYTGMGSTVSVVFFTEQTIVAANVGDSPIYLVQKDRIELLSEPHTVVAEHAAIDPEGARQLSGEFKHMLTRAMGTEATVKANVCELPYFKDDVLVMSSDGLSDLVQPEEILAIAGAERPETACRALVDLANDRGGVDNITVIVLKVKRTGSGNGKMRNLLSRMTEGFSNIKAKKKAVD